MFEILYPDEIRRPGMGLDYIAAYFTAVDTAATVSKLLKLGWTLQHYEKWVVELLTLFLDPTGLIKTPEPRPHPERISHQSRSARSVVLLQRHQEELDDHRSQKESPRPAINRCSAGCGGSTEDPRVQNRCCLGLGQSSQGVDPERPGREGRVTRPARARRRCTATLHTAPSSVSPIMSIKTYAVGRLTRRVVQWSSR
jgi:hypothetical protein